MGLEIDAEFDLMWVLRARYYLGTGDIPAAEAAAEEAKRVQALYPEESADPALVETLVNDIALAKERAGQLRQGGVGPIGWGIATADLLS